MSRFPFFGDKPYVPVDYAPRKCGRDGCGNMFKPARSNHWYCSAECGKKDWKARDKNKRQVQRAEDIIREEKMAKNINLAKQEYNRLQLSEQDQAIKDFLDGKFSGGGSS